MSQHVTLAGRVLAIRNMGSRAFVDVRDGTAKVQLNLGREAVFSDTKRPSQKAKWQSEVGIGLNVLDVGDFVQAYGRLFRTRLGEVTLQVESWGLLTKTLRPLPDKWHGISDVETRYRQRYLDLIANERSREIALLRTKVLAAVRLFYIKRDFIEVETPVLQDEAGGAAARPFITHHNALDRDFFLRISLELHLKRLLVGGFDKVFEIGRVFRNEGIDRRHNPEFSLLESYEAYTDYLHVAKMVEDLYRFVAMQVRGTLQIPFGEEIIDLGVPWARITYRDALRKYAGFTYSESTTVDDLRGIAAGHRIATEASDSKDTILDKLMSELVEPQLIQPTFLLDYPSELSPLAKKKPGFPDTAERFELFVLGYEMANAYSEQNDPDTQRLSMLDQAFKAAEGDEEVEIADEDFLTALEYGMPPAGGLGFGIERMVMLMAGEPSIREVILFPAMRDNQR